MKLLNFGIAAALCFSFDSFAQYSDYSYEDNNYTYSACNYQDKNLVRVNLKNSCSGKNSICVGRITCDYREKATGKTGKYSRTVVCDTNDNGTCPTPGFCHEKGSELATDFQVGIRVQNPTAAAEEAKLTARKNNDNKNSQTTTTQLTPPHTLPR